MLHGFDPDQTTGAETAPVLDRVFQVLEQAGYTESLLAGIFGVVAGITFFAIRRARAAALRRRDQGTVGGMAEGLAAEGEPQDQWAYPFEVRPGDDHALGSHPKTPCRWSMSSAATRVPMQLWICDTCGVDVYAGRNRPPEGCKRHQEPRAPAGAAGA